MKLDFLWSDYLIWGMVLALGVWVVWALRYPHWREPWQQVLSSRAGAAAAVILVFYTIIGLLDSVHWQTHAGHDAVSFKSLLDLWVRPLGERTETTYSAPFAQRLTPGAGGTKDIIIWIIMGASIGLGIGLCSFSTFMIIYSRRQHQSIIYSMIKIFRGQTQVSWRAVWITVFLLWILIGICAFLATHYHILGTDKIGRDVFYQTIKSIRTGLIIGTLTTVFTLPLALLLGAIAGYFRGWVDDIIQYLYTTLSSIPGVLLISASVLVLQVYMVSHADNYPTLTQRADVRLLALCFILAITGWADLCRFLRGETLKIRELEFVQAAHTLGATSMQIIFRHIIPNIFHIVIITLVLDFSGLVLAEAVLSYVGVGVDPTTISWGNMINSSRLELAREPVVWWPLLAALLGMFGLVLAANIFADAVRDAFDPSLRIEP